MNQNNNYFQKYQIYKIKYLKLKKQIGKGLNHPIKVMSWNVCWEALEGAQSHNLDKTDCKVANINICAENIKKIIQQKLDESYDIICLQEIRQSQWENLNISTPSHTVIFNDIKFAGIITIIKNDYNIENKLKGNLIDPSYDIRPYTILVLSNNMILINVHFPHLTENQIDSIDTIKNQLEKLSNKINLNTAFLICGDFNNNDPSLLPNFKFILPYSFKFNKIKNKINTCYISDNHRMYKLSYDHIYSNLKNINYKTLNDDDLAKYQLFFSDHLPLFAEFV